MSHQTEPGELYNGPREGVKPSPQGRPVYSEHQPAEPEAPKKRRCRALNRAGEPCKSTSVGPDQLCAYHAGRAPLGTVQDGRNAGRASAKARRERSEARARKLAEAELSLSEVLKLRALERREAVAEALISSAIEQRDVSALRLLLDRVEGKVADQLNVSNDLTPEELEMVHRSREYLKLIDLTDDQLEALRKEGGTP